MDFEFIPIFMTWIILIAMVLYRLYGCTQYKVFSRMHAQQEFFLYKKAHIFNFNKWIWIHPQCDFSFYNFNYCVTVSTAQSPKTTLKSAQYLKFCEWHGIPLFLLWMFYYHWLIRKLLWPKAGQNRTMQGN